MNEGVCGVCVHACAWAYTNEPAYVCGTKCKHCVSVHVCKKSVWVFIYAIIYVCFYVSQYVCAYVQYMWVCVCVCVSVCLWVSLCVSICVCL